jgi:uncharacterized protein
MEEIFGRAVEFLRGKLNSSDKVDEVEKKYRFEHSMRVASIARTVAEKEGHDVFVVTVAAILHDVGKFDTEVNVEHGRVSANCALPFLEGLGLDERVVRDIHFCIASHVDGSAGYDYEDIPEAETVSDADNIDRFGVYRIYQSLTWDNIDLTPPEETIAKLEKRIAWTKNFRDTYKLYTETANRMLRDNLNIQIEFYENLARELRLTGFK